MKRSLARYAVAVVAAALALVLRAWLSPVLGMKVPFITAFPAVMVSAWFGGLGPGLVTTAICAAVIEYLWLPPRSFGVADVGDIVALLLFASVGVFISALNERVHRLRRASSRARMEAETQGREYWSVLESIADSFSVVGADWRYIFVNGALAQSSGRRPDELLGRTLWDVFPGLLGTRFEQEARRAMRDRVSVQFQYVDERLGRWYEVRLYQWRTGLSILATDVTDAKRAEDERARLLAQEQAARARAEDAERRLAFKSEIARSITASLDLGTVLQRIADGAKDLCHSDTAAIFLRDGDSGAMVPRYRVGPWLTVYDTLRIVPGQGLGGQVMTSGRPLRTERYLDDERISQPLGAIARETGTVTLMVVPIIAGSGVEGLLYVSNRTARAFTDDDETICVHLAEQAAIAIQNAQLFAREQAARAEAESASRSKDEFLAMLGHELRNPLGAIGNAAGILRDVGGRDELAAHARDVIARQVGHLSRLMDDLLDVGRVMTGKIIVERAAIDLLEVTTRALATLRAAGRAGHHRLEVDGEHVWIEADGARMEQVVTNLVVNALKYTPPGGSIHLSVAREGPMALLKVEDSGIGMAPELLPRIFDLFVQGERSLDRAQGGLGIGLTLVKQVVALHGGTIEAHSDGAGRGSVFRVRIPAIDAPAVTSGSRATPADVVATRILVIEDNDDSRDMLAELLKLSGHVVFQAANGPDGVNEALRLRPDVALVDVGLPGLDGYEVARRVRAAPGGDAIVLVALTGYGQPEDRRRAMQAGFDAHLVKPVDPHRLAEVLAGANLRRPA